jgi:hypothetical protein
MWKASAASETYALVLRSKVLLEDTQQTLQHINLAVFNKDRTGDLKCSCVAMVLRASIEYDDLLECIKELRCRGYLL